MRPPIVTERLLLRDIAEADAEFLFELDSDPEVLRYVGPRPGTDVEAYRERIRAAYLPWQAHPWHGVRIVCDRTTEEFLGWVFVRPADASLAAVQLGWSRADEIEVGYRFLRSAWGSGIATESALPLVKLALADPAVHSVVACALAANDASLRVLEKLGLIRVAELQLHDPPALGVKLALMKAMKAN